MTTIEIRFISGRWHATSWDQHVNEGITEWPPSPWRFLRALLATWHLKAMDLPREDVQALIEALAAAECQFRLPTDVQAPHTRHYMPIAKGNTTKVLDSFLVVQADDPLIINFDTDLSADLTGILERLTRAMTYFGRAETWADIRVTNTSVAANCTAKKADAGSEPVRVLTPMSESEYQIWRQGIIAGATRQKIADTAAKKKLELGDVKLTKGDLKSIDALVPESLFDALHLDTADVQKGGWNIPPGATWVTMQRPRLMTLAAPPKISWTKTNDDIDVIRFALYSNVLPRWTDILHVGSAFHTQIAKKAKELGVSEDLRTRLTGRTADNELAKGHNHLFILPELHPDKIQKIGGLSLYMPGGVDREAIDFFAEFSKLEAWNEDHQDQDLVFLDMEDSRQNGFSNSFGEDEVWESLTPFVATRHNKPGKTEFGYEVGSAEHDLHRLLLLGGFDAPSSIERIDKLNLDKDLRWTAFRTHRRNRSGARGPHIPGGFRIIFKEPQKGPIALGYGAHFGLGLFRRSKR